MAGEMVSQPGLTFHQGYLSDPFKRQGLADLLRETFEIDIGALDRIGGMDPSSMPFAWFAGDGVCAANFSAFSIPMMISGRMVRVAGLQSGAVRPEWRGRGLYRDLMRRAFEWIDAREYALSILYTDKPALYEPYGFEAVPVFKFAGKAPGTKMPQGLSRLLDIDNPEDVGLLTRLIQQCAAASNVFAPISHPSRFLENALWDRSISLSYLKARGAAVAWRVTDGGVFQLLDVVARKIPPLAAILAALGIGSTFVECLFSPDLLEWSAEAVLDEDRLAFMVRGDRSLLPSEPFALTPMADF